MDFSQNMFTKEFLLSGNRLPEGRDRLSVAQIFMKMVFQRCNRLPWHYNRLPMLITFINILKNLVINYTNHVTDYQWL